MDLIRWIRGQHRGVRGFFEASVYSVLSPDQLRQRPGGIGNSVAWLMWHLARTEDAIVNSIIRGEKQVLLGDGWIDNLGVDVTNIGTGLGDDEVEAISAGMDIEACNGYWKTVADQTSEWLKTIGPEALEEVPDMQARIATIPAMIAGADNANATSFWTGRSAGYLLGGTVISHGYIHVGEMNSIRGRIGVSGWV